MRFRKTVAMNNISRTSFFTVYQTQAAVELRLGHHDRPSIRTICSSASYENAKQFAQRCAKLSKLPFIDYVGSDDVGSDDYIEI